MKVLLIAHACQVPNEGQQRTDRLGALPGVDLRVIVPDRWNEYGRWRKSQLPANAPCVYQEDKIRLPWTGPAQWYLHHYPSMAATLRSFRPDVIDIWEEPWGLASAHTCWLRNRILPSAKIVTETEANINRHHPFPFTNLRRYTLRNADYAVTRNTEGIQTLREHGYKGPAEVVGNGVDVSLFRPMDREACRRAIGMDGFIVGYVGRLIEAKGLMDMVEAVAACPPDVKMLFVGSGVYQPALESRIAELGLQERTRFIPPRKMEELPALMNAMDTLLLVSRTTRTWKEQFGRVIAEAHACGVSVVGSDSGAIPEVVAEGGLIVPESNPAALTKALMTLRNDPALCRELGRRGRKQVEEHYSWERVAEKFRDIYERMLAGRPELTVREALAA